MRGTHVTGLVSCTRMAHLSVVCFPPCPRLPSVPAPPPRHTAARGTRSVVLAIALLETARPRARRRESLGKFTLTPRSWRMPEFSSSFPGFSCMRRLAARGMLLARPATGSSTARDQRHACTTHAGEAASKQHAHARRPRGAVASARARNRSQPHRAAARLWVSRRRTHRGAPRAARPRGAPGEGLHPWARS